MRKIGLLTLAGFLIFWSAKSLSDIDSVPATPSEKTIVIVHGAWGGGWAFRQIEALLREQGYQVYRPTLTGLGERKHLSNPDIDLNTHIEDITNLFLFEKLDHVLLVGHSYGGMVITGVANSLPERIHHLVYLDAFLPFNNESVMSLTESQNWQMKDLVKNGLLVPGWTNSDQPYPKDVPQSAKTFTQPILLDSKKRFHGSFILTVDQGKEATEDRFFRYSERAKSLGYDILTLESNHNPQWSAPEPLARMIDQIYRKSIKIKKEH